MNEKEVAEIRRRFRPDKNNITHILGCYVNEKSEILSEFSQPLSLMPQEEAETFLGILKRALSGTINKNLIDIEFTTQQVIDSPEHQLLMQLRRSELKDETAVRSLFEKIISCVAMQGNYLILLTYDAYDVPYRSKDGARHTDADTDVFSYILCSICPVTMTKPALSYYAQENAFRNRLADWIVSPPQLGFLFPSFDDRSANIYNSLYYTKDTADSHPEFADVVFKRTVPMPAATQKETFQAVLGGSLEDECSFDTIQAVHGELQEMIDAHKANKEETPLMISKSTVRQILTAEGVSEAHLAAFEEEFDVQFGAETTLSPKNIVDTKQIELATADVKVQVSGDRNDLVETRIIDGKRYILIRAEGSVELNGIPLHIS